jgi:hypothetical protein
LEQKSWDVEETRMIQLPNFQGSRAMPPVLQPGPQNHSNQTSWLQVSPQVFAMTSTDHNSSSNPPTVGFDSNGQPPRSHTIDAIDHRIDSQFDGLKRWRKNKTTHLSLQEWEQRNLRQPYHEYVHQLVAAGWDDLSDLDLYMTTAPTQQPGLVISVLDIENGFRKKRWPEIHNEHELKEFMSKGKGPEAKVRLYLAEYSRCPATCIIEAFGGALKLDPRFFNWSIQTKGHVFTLSQRYRAPYTALGFGVLVDTSTATPRKTDAERFKVLIYIRPDEHGVGWTGVILFSSHTKINLSPRIVTDPPLFQSHFLQNASKQSPSANFTFNP